MPDAHIMEAATNLLKAAQTKREEKKQLLAEADSTHRDIDKQVGSKSFEHKQLMNRVTKVDVNARDTVLAMSTAHTLKKEMDDMKKFDNQKLAELHKTADRLEQEAVALESEARNLQARA